MTGYQQQSQKACLQVEQWWPLDRHWPQLAKTALLIGAVSILEAISIAKALAERHGDKISPDRELVGGLNCFAGQAICACPEAEHRSIIMHAVMQLGG